MSPALSFFGKISGMYPFIPAVANFVFPGLGYLLVRRRVTFGWIMLVGTGMGWFWSIKYPLPDSFFVGESLFLCTAAYLCISVAFAYDAYTEAKRR